jgi:RNA polymerase sigma-70 factor (ECF subfamily)
MTFLRAAGCDEALADDVWQESMIVAWKKLDEFDRNLAFGPWLRGIAAKLLLNARRKSGRLHLVGDESELNYLSERLDRVHSLSGDTLDEKLEALRDCITELPDSDRECIELRFRDDLMPAAICQRIGLTLDTVKKRLQRAKQRLQICMEKKIVGT